MNETRAFSVPVDNPHQHKLYAFKTMCTKFYFFYSGWKTSLD